MAQLSFSVFIFGLVAAALAVVCNGKNVPRFFILGDSLVDVGNNNYIETIAKANSVPNGCDFVPSGRKPTGRYTNGKTVADLIVDGFSTAACYPPPYLGPGAVDAATMCGINYASGGAGILNKTGYVFLGRVNMDEQIDNLAETKQAILKKFGPAKTQEIMATAFFPIIIGSNDFLDNYFVPLIGGYKYIRPEDYVEQLISKFRDQMIKLYNLGARRYLIVNLGPLGCIPYQRTLHKTGDKCAEETNAAARLFNSRLQDLTFGQLSPKLPEADFYYANVYNALNNILANSVRYGFEVPDKACCKFSEAGMLVEAVFPCNKKCTHCSDRSKYVFWDSFHPSEAANILLARMLLEGGPEFIIPNNIRHAMKLYGY